MNNNPCNCESRVVVPNRGVRVHRSQVCRFFAEKFTARSVGPSVSRRRPLVREWLVERIRLHYVDLILTTRASAL